MPTTVATAVVFRNVRREMGMTFGWMVGAQSRFMRDQTLRRGESSIPNTQAPGKLQIRIQGSTARSPEGVAGARHPCAAIEPISTRCVLSGNQKSMKWFLKAIAAGALMWVAINLVAMGYQPAQAGSVIATVEIALALVVAILACVVLCWPLSN